MRPLCLLATFALSACGGGPAPTPAEAAPEAPASMAPDLPNPCVANPCDATLIDPSVNPCVDPAPEGGK